MTDRRLGGIFFIFGFQRMGFAQILWEASRRPPECPWIFLDFSHGQIPKYLEICRKYGNGVFQ